MYIDPKTVLSPKGKVSKVKVLFDAGPVDHSWSVAQVVYDDQPRIGIRWNGDPESHIGLPQSRGNPTWFILPDEIAEAIDKRVRELNGSHEEQLLSGYRQMAADRERETEVEEWIEGLVSDAF